jgi:hypothetical protein
VQM